MRRANGRSPNRFFRGSDSIFRSSGVGLREISQSTQPMTLHFQLAGLQGKLSWKALEKECHDVLAAAFARGEGL